MSKLPRVLKVTGTSSASKESVRSLSCFLVTIRKTILRRYRFAIRSLCTLKSGVGRRRGPSQTVVVVASPAHGDPTDRFLKDQGHVSAILFKTFLLKDGFNKTQLAHESFLDVVLNSSI